MPLTEAQPDALARVYSESLFGLARSAGGQHRVEEVLGELEHVAELARTDARFSEFLASRILPAKDRAGSIRAIFSGRISDLTLHFLLVLNEKGRLGHFLPIVASFDQLVQAEFGRVEVDVYTASPLDGADLDAIRTRLRDVLGKEPIVHPYTDRSMIGGLKLQIGDRLVDGSLATKLRRLKDHLAEGPAAAIRTRARQIIDDSASASD